jgi:RNA polymerase sigma-70 factor (sigma-E family)
VTEIERLYVSERPRLLRLAAMLVGDRATAEDVVHDAFASVQRRWNTLDDPTAAAAYLSACVANGARSVLRHRRVTLRRIRVGEPDSGPAADAALMLAEEHRAVVAAVRRLPRRQQQVLVLRYWAGLSEAQIAEAMKISAGAVKSSAARGLMKVKLRLEAEQ